MLDVEVVVEKVTKPVGPIVFLVISLRDQRVLCLVNLNIDPVITLHIKKLECV